MLWIIWTCGWFLACGLESYLASLEKKLTSNTPREGSAVMGFIYMVVWIIGMINFWGK